LLALPQAAEHALRADAEQLLAVLLAVQGDYERADWWLGDALAMYRAHGDRLGIASTLRLLGANIMWRGDLEHALAVLAEAAELLHELGDADALGAVFNRATVALELGHPLEALSAADLLDAPDQPWQPPVGHAHALILRGGAAARRGELAIAEQALEQARDLAQRLTYPRMTILVLTELGHVLLDFGKAAPAGAAFREALESALESGERIRIARAFEAIARLAAIQPDGPAAAVRLAAAATALRNSLGAAPWPRDLRRGRLWLPVTRRALGAAAYHAAWRAGALLSVEEAATLAFEMLAASDSPNASSGPLTARETEVAVLISRGHATAQIAADLVISVATVRVHIDHILAKLGLHSRAEIARWVQMAAHNPPIGDSPGDVVRRTLSPHGPPE
jgi:non-specific serine/threonine protein kinase